VQVGAGVVLSVVVGGPAACLADEPRPKAGDFLGVWLEERRETGGKVHDQPRDLFGWDFSAEEAGCWERRGESVFTDLGTVRVRVDRDPVWLDLVGENRPVEVGGRTVEKVPVLAGIARREGAKLVWVVARDWQWTDPLEPPERIRGPASFEVRKDDPWEKLTLFRGRDRYDAD
jgi:hypothetical protein